MQDEDTSIDKNADADTIQKTALSHACDESHTEDMVTHPVVEKGAAALHGVQARYSEGSTKMQRVQFLSRLAALPSS